MTNRDEDQDWLDALAGKPDPDANPAVTKRATLLRQAIQQHDAALGVNDFDTEAGLQKLKFRMRREGLVTESKPSFIHNRFVQYAMAASIILTVGLTMRLYLYEQPIQNEIGIVRGSNQQIVLAADPEARLKQLTTELDKLGIQYQVDRKEGGIILMARGVDPVKDDVAEFLERNHITAPVGTDLALELRPLPKP
jgi:hypothetical protein